MCTNRCVTTTTIFMALYVAVILLCLAVFAIVNPILGLICISVLPACYVVLFWAKHWQRHTLSQQVTFTMLEAVGLMLPLLVVTTVMTLFLDIFLGRSIESGSPRGPVDAFIVAFFFAAIPEEILKYITVRHIVWMEHVCDPRGLVVYAIAACAAFAAVENLAYVFTTGQFIVGVARSLASVPGHISTGIIMAGTFGRHKFLEGSVAEANTMKGCGSVLAVPILLHGSYNFCLMAGGASAFGLLGALLVDACGLTLARRGIAALGNVVPVDVHELVAAGLVSKPVLRCCAALCYLKSKPSPTAAADSGYNAPTMSRLPNQAPSPGAANGAAAGGYLRCACPRCTLELVVYAPLLRGGVGQSVQCPMCDELFTSVAAPNSYVGG